MAARKLFSGVRRLTWRETAETYERHAIAAVARAEKAEAERDRLAATGNELLARLHFVPNLPANVEEAAQAFHAALSVAEPPAPTPRKAILDAGQAVYVQLACILEADDYDGRYNSNSLARAMDGWREVNPAAFPAPTPETT